VRVNDDVRPKQFAGKPGTVVEVRRVVPLSIVRGLALQGKRPSNGDIEIGVRLGNITRSQNFMPVWFLPHELVAAKVG
jgi:hypothetical protein